MGTDSLPHDTDAERALIGAAAINQSQVGELRRAAHALYHQWSKQIAAAIIGLADEGLPVDPVLVGSRLEDKALLVPLGECIQGVPRASNAKHYADVVLAKGYRRVMMGHASAVQAAASNGQTDEDLFGLVEGLRGLEAPSRGVRVETAAEICARPCVPVPWLVEGIWTHPEVSILAGDGGIGKTWIGLHVGFCLASMNSVFGRNMVPTMLKVGVLDQERGPEAMDWRVQRMSKGMDIGVSALARIEVVRDRFVLDDLADAQRLIAYVRESGISWLLIDSLQTSMDGKDTDGQDVQRVFRTALYPIRDLGCSVLLIDHYRKSRGEAALDAPSEALHGSKRKRNSADSLVGLSRKSGTTDTVAWQPDKANHHAPSEPCQLRVVVTDDFARVEYAGSLDSASDAVQDALIARLKAGDTRRRDFITTIPQFSRASLERGLATLTHRGLVEKENSGAKTAYVLRRSRGDEEIG